MSSLSMNESVRYGNAWRVEGCGPLLTNRRIRQLELEGHYGRERQLAANQSTLLRRDGRVIRCARCDGALGVRFLRYAYLPRSGYYCIQCVKLLRSARDKEQEQRHLWRESLEGGHAYE